MKLDQLVLGLDFGNGDRVAVAQCDAIAPDSLAGR